MKIVMTLLVRNEEDIIRENIEFHLSQGVSHFIATDNLSADGTTAILKEYEDKGVLTYFYEDSELFDQHIWVTRMAVEAFAEHNADWVINNDADEFWWPRSGTLIDAFQSVPEQYNLLEARRTNFVMVGGGVAPFYRRMIYRQVVPLNSLGQSLPPKLAHRGSEDIIVAPGNHSVSGFHNMKKKHGLIDVLHYPMRISGQFENKIKYGGAAYERNKIVPEDVGITWRSLYSEYKEHSSLRDYCNQQTYDNERIQEELAIGQIVEDCRLSDYLSQLPGLKSQ